MSVGGGGEAGRVQYLDGHPRLPDDDGPRSKMLDPLRAEGARGVAIAVLSTVVVLGLLVWWVTSSPNWPAVRDAFFNGQEFRQTFPDIVKRFGRNVEFFLVAEVFILTLALFLAVLRSLPGPVFFPLRAMAIVYTDLFRGIPTVLVVYLLGFGVPSLQLPGVPIDAAFWGVVALILSYSAYVSEVYRAGIETVHPSQVASARSLGLSRWQSLRFVVIPQAVRRVVPPLLNDFVALQKDTALVSFVGVVEILNYANLYKNKYFNLSPVTGAAIAYLIITIPVTRFVDYLIRIDKERTQAK
ncbi:MAG: amino acid ABC transporter permease [Actinomycetota bacterium]